MMIQLGEEIYVKFSLSLVPHGTVKANKTVPEFHPL
jgi:hypothetical protein